MDSYGVNPSGNREMRFTGVAAEDKEPGSKILKVRISELTPVASGQLKANDKDYSVSGGSGGFSGNAKAADYVIATYKGDASNRRYCPDVVLGEEVIVFTDARNDSIWYWEATTKDQKQRTSGERVGEIANNAQNPEDLNESNTYGHEANTKGKYYKIYTSKSNGEPFAYSILIDAGNGVLTIADDDENKIELDSNIPRIVIKNKNGCFIEMSQNNINVTAVDDLTLKAGRQVILETPAITLENQNGGGAAIWNVNQIQFNTQSFTVNGSCIGMYGHMEVPTIVANFINSGSYSDCGGISGGSMRSMAVMSLMRSAPMGVRSYTMPESPFGVDLTGTYAGPQINIMDGSVSLGANTPNMYGSIMANRHCAAWENMLASVKHLQASLATVAEDLVKIDGVIGYGNNASNVLSEAASAVSEATASKMEMNRGI